MFPIVHELKHVPTHVRLRTTTPSPHVVLQVPTPPHALHTDGVPVLQKMLSD